MSMDEDKKRILEYIAKTGDCDQLELSACYICPLGKLKRRSDGTGWLSCIEAVSGTFTPVTNDKYKKIAEEILADLVIQDQITDSDGTD